MWTFTGYCTFLPFCCKLSESLTHHGSQFPEGEAENCRKPAFRCKSGTGPNMQWHGMVAFLDGADPWFSKEQGLTWKPFMCHFYPFLSMFRFWYLCQTLHCQPLHRKASNLHPSRCQSRVAVKYIPYCAGRGQKTAGRICSVYTCKRKSWGGPNADSHVVQLSRETQIPVHRPG